MYIDIERIAQLSIALLAGCFYYFILIPKLKRMSWLLLLIFVWLSGFILMRDALVEVVLMLNDGVYPLSMEQYIVLGQDVFFSVACF